MNRYVYLIDGEPYVGTLVDFAHAHEQAEYGTYDVSDCVWIVNGHDLLVRTTPERRSTPYNSDDYATVTYRLDGEEASYRVDGRA